MIIVIKVYFSIENGHYRLFPVVTPSSDVTDLKLEIMLGVLTGVSCLKARVHLNLGY